MSSWKDLLMDCQNATLTTTRKLFSVGDLDFEEPDNPVAVDLQIVAALDGGDIMNFQRVVFLAQPNKLRETVNSKFEEAFDYGIYQVVAIRVEVHGGEDEEGDELVKTYIILQEDLLFKDDEDDDE